MFLLHVLILWQIQGALQYQFNMYNTDHGQDGYCLLYYVDRDDSDRSPSRRAHQIIPYCLRSSEESISIAPLRNSTMLDSTTSFAELRKRNISSELLISWSAPIDQVERYQLFLYNMSNSSSEANTLFYNCTFPWFGPFCRFAFDIAEDYSLNENIYWNFMSKGIMPDDIKVTCYKHLHCNPSLICLDWREICDGKIDCRDGSDEFNCWQLEMNECTKNEYRCYNGQCISDKFLHDYELEPDCLDRTDEFKTSEYPDLCWSDPSFRCEEHKCHPGIADFPCGDGRCEEEMFICSNGRNTNLNIGSCSNAMACDLQMIWFMNNEWCKQHCTEGTCVTKYCPSFYEFPTGPILFGHVRFIFSREEFELRDGFPIPKYVCYNEELCADFLPATEHWNNLTCRYFHELGFEYSSSGIHFPELIRTVKNRFRACLMVSNEILYLNQTMMYQCQNSSKYISKHRLLDMTMDCPFGDDETSYNESCSLNDANYRFHCSIDDSRLCFAPFIPGFDTTFGYEYGCARLGAVDIGLEARDIYFETICDGHEDLLPGMTKGQNETDETGCEHWFCNNTYTRCNSLWSCRDGADEVNCPHSTCPEFYHSCVFLNDTSKVACLPMSRANDGIVDCLGATDERNRCQYAYLHGVSYGFRCRDDTACLFNHQICDGETDCQFGDDEVFCNSANGWSALPCWQHESLTEVEDFLCNFTKPIEQSVRFFKLHNMPSYPSQLSLNNDSSALVTEKRALINPNNLMVNNINADPWRCNRGLRIHIRTNNDTYNLSCLCSPSYYGNQCQYQNQRVSLTVQIRATSDWTTIFTLLIFLIDDETNIESHDHIEYLPSRDCDIKFNVYLLYSTRPKNSSRNYSIRIDAFNRMKMNYRASWIFPLQFSFLPVHRLPVHLIIPMVNVEPFSQCPFPCIHGQCFSIVNHQNSSFCRCFPGWSGHQCTKNYSCNCELNSQCIDDSICLCPVGRFGPRCYLFQSSCQSNFCINGGQCIHENERYTYAHKNKSKCICPSEYIGDRCESPRSRQTRIDISFDNSLIIPPSLVVHLVQVQYNPKPNQTGMIQKIGFDQSSVTFYTSTIFNLAFAEMLEKYYLIILQEENINSSRISTKILPSHRCLSINELFNETVVQEELLKRIKLYHIPCNKQRQLVCFYDSIHFCLCDNDRHANCFRFDHNVRFDCDGYNLCENDGQCYLDDRKCPTLAFCACSQCSFGSKCQFSTSGSTLLLDIILGYRINPNTGITQQANIVKVALAVTTIIFVLSLISNLCTFLTFQMKNTRDVGCGIYLWTSSVIGLIITCVLTIKFWLLLTSQMGSIKNHLFIQFQCISIDFILRVLIVCGDWFRACTSIERAINVFQGVYFNKLKSKQIAKRILLLIFLFVSCTHIHDPIHRRLINDDEEERSWCVTKYSSFLTIFDWTVNIIHFSIPFLINFISALSIIINAARIRTNAQKNLSYKHFLRKQFQQHKHLLISSVVLVLLAIPRLYISLLSGCMKSPRDSWFYLIGYYISFIPSMLNFAIFVLPSKLYKIEFKKSIQRFL